MNRLIKNDTEYLNLIRTVLQFGDKKIGRNGNTISYFGHQMRFDLRDNIMPIITTKKMAWKTCLKELLWFVKGHTDNKILKDQNVRIWNGNATREFLDSRGLITNEEDDLGPIYGFQWNNFNGTYRAHNDYDNDGVNQLDYIVKALKNTSNEGENKYSRRLVVSAWNPCQLDQMALPPCHVLFQFYVNSQDELSCHLYQRSGDVGLGVPFNIASYAFLTHLIAFHCDLKPGHLVHSIGDCHIYDDHVVVLSKQLSNKIYDSPKLVIKEKKEHLCDYTVDDFIVSDYNYAEVLKMDMRV